MRCTTLVITDLVLRHGGVRAAARVARLPVSTVSAAIARLEDRLGLTVLRRTGAGVSPTIQAAPLSPAIARMAELIREIHGLDRDAVPHQSIRLVTLFRLAQAMRSGSIRGGAAEMSISQPQLTRDIARIETTLGDRLFHRDRHGITPTAAGLHVCALIDQLELEWRAFASMAIHPPPLLSQRVTLGTVTPANPLGGLAQLIGDTAVRLSTREGLLVGIAAGVTEQLVSGLARGRFDAIVIDVTLPDRSYQQQVLMRVRLALMGHDIPERGDLAAPLTRRPLALQSSRSGLRQMAERLLRDTLGPDWRARVTLLEVDSLPVIVSMVARGHANSVLPVNVSELLPGLSFSPLPHSFDLPMTLVWRRTPRAERFARLIISGLAAPPG